MIIGKIVVSFICVCKLFNDLIDKPCSESSLF